MKMGDDPHSPAHRSARLPPIMAGTAVPSGAVVMVRRGGAAGRAQADRCRRITPMVAAATMIAITAHAVTVQNPPW